jgi:polysaccharide export outer membrane protein
MVYNSTQGTFSSSGTQTGSTATINGYQVDNLGNISVFKLGAVRAEGLTRNELTQKLQKELSPYLKDPVVTIRFLNNHVTVLGEVAKPQVLTMPTEQMSILDAIGMSGDLTIAGRRDNILVIRETPTGKQFKRLNITDNSIFNSPFYYLRPNDVVYVEPSELKIKNSGNGPQTIGYLLTGLSIAITLLLNIFR